MKINRDYFNNLEKPTFILYKASGDRVDTIPVIEATYDENYMDADTMNIVSPLYIDGKLNSVYEQIDIMKYVEVSTVGIFSIQSVNIQSEGTDIERKEISLKSVETLLATKYLEEFVINYGTTESIDGVCLYNLAKPEESLLNLIIDEKFPDWSIGYVDPELASKQRSFEVSRQDIYSFLMEDVAQAFDAAITFNTFTKEISVYKAEHFEVDTNIHISYNNLLKTASVDCSTDEIKTALTLSGDDDLTVREINFGLDTIYNINYFANTEYMSQDLYDAYVQWAQLMTVTIDPTLFTYEPGVIEQQEIQGLNYRNAYSVLLEKYQGYYTEIARWQSEIMPVGSTDRNIGYGEFPKPSDPDEQIVIIPKQTKWARYNTLPSTGDVDTLYMSRTGCDMYRYTNTDGWINVNNWGNAALDPEAYCYALNPLNSELETAKKLVTNAMNAGYGEDNTNGNDYYDDRYGQRHYYNYVSTYLPNYYTQLAVEKQIPNVEAKLAELKRQQDIILQDMDVITNLIDMNNNFTPDQLKELSTFIREEELSSSNYVVTDEMTTDEKFQMLRDMMEYGEKELDRISSPQLQFASELENLYEMPEFESYADDFDTGKFIWVTLRDDFSVKAKLLTIHVNYFDASDFSATFGNVRRKGKNIFTDLQTAINEAHSAATSVSFNASYWNQAAKEANGIMTSLSEGLLNQGTYLSTPDKNTVLIDENGLWVTTTSGPHGKDNTDDYDAIYIGGGRILMTSDGWRSVRMSVGRADLTIHQLSSDKKKVTQTQVSAFGVLADYVIAGVVEGSTIVGGDVVSDNYNEGSAGTRFDLENGKMYVYGSKGSIVFDGTNLSVKGDINATSGTFGADGSNKIKIGTSGSDSFIYSGSHTSYSSNNAGFYIGNSGISLGSQFRVAQDGKLTASNVDVTGKITASEGSITGNLQVSGSLYTQGKSGSGVAADGLFIGSNGIYMGAGNQFYVTNNGNLHANNADISGTISATSGTFENVTIKNPLAGSNFGGLSWNGTGTSLWCPNGFSPFSGGASAQIQTLAANKITADYVNSRIGEITTLGANAISASGNITAAGAITGTKLYDTYAGSTTDVSAMLRTRAKAGWYEGVCNLTTGVVRIEIKA